MSVTSDTTLVVIREEELQNILVKVKEENEKVDLKTFRKLRS